MQQHLDKPRLNDIARLWLQRLWKKRIAVYEVQHWLETQRRGVLTKSTSLVSAGSLIMMRLIAQTKAA